MAPERAEQPRLLLRPPLHRDVPSPPPEGADGECQTVQGGFLLVFKFVRMDSTRSQWEAVANMQ